MFSRKPKPKPPIRQPGAVSSMVANAIRKPNFDQQYFQETLLEANKPVTHQNLYAVAAFACANLAINAHHWLGVIGSPQDRASWDQLFVSDERDEQMMTRPARMAEFLWAMNEKLHPALAGLPADLRKTTIRRASDFGPYLPEDLFFTD